MISYLLRSFRWVVFYWVFQPRWWFSLHFCLISFQTVLCSLPFRLVVFSLRLRLSVRFLVFGLSQLSDRWLSSILRWFGPRFVLKFKLRTTNKLQVLPLIDMHWLIIRSLSLFIPFSSFDSECKTLIDFSSLSSFSSASLYSFSLLSWIRCRLLLSLRLSKVFKPY